MAFRNTMPSMNWNAKDTSEIAINQIYSEHVEKEAKYMRPKTIYTCNPCPSIVMNTGLGSRQTFVTDKVRGTNTAGNRD
jgi:hypothetical protein